MLCCWLAAVGAGLLKSEEILEGVARLRLSNDIEFEEETFISMMNEAKEVSSQIYAFCGLLTLVNVSIDEVYWYEFYTNLQSNAIEGLENGTKI